MIEEKREILRMLSEGTIDVEGAERLLAALEKGGQKRRGMKSRPEHGRTTGASTIAEAMNTIRETVAGIGSAVREAMESGESGEFDPDEEEICSCGEELALSEGSFPVGKDSIVRVTHPRGKAPGSLSVSSIEGGFARIGQGSAARVFNRGNEVIVIWTGGNLSLELPASTGRLKARSKGGDISACGLPFPSSLRTMGGNLDLVRMNAPFKARTMGGTIRIAITGKPSGSSIAKTIGGNISIELDSEARGSLGLLLETIGGTISGDAAGSSFGSPGRATFESGKDREHRLIARTMGGNIHASGGTDA
ncbi:MAG TPA: hypothetical protein PLF04_03065 [Candidatus Fermentibacter daniensis]|nr:hypothetical protein [Candidatus Fermentibacter daniensis]HPH39165.1 hypothetical protein [Candidatus Fermentibacter daniensis]HPN62627.1 hypothetical protein [Candidatus Fermentibacter daniensis]